MQTNAAAKSPATGHAAEILRLSDLERAASREPHALVSEIAAAILDPASNPLRMLADLLCDVCIVDVRADALRMLAVHAARAEHFRRAGKAHYEQDSAGQADAAIRRYANLAEVAS